MGASKNVVIVGGKSGGHTFPALAVAEALLDISSDLNIHFIHSGSPLEKSVFFQEGWTAHFIFPLALAGGVSFISRLKTLIILPFVFIKVFFLVMWLRPQAVFGTGGAVSAPVLFSAFLLGRRRAIWEGNAICGLANRWLAAVVPVVFTVFPDVLNISRKKQILCGYPLRREFVSKTQGFRKTENNLGLFRVLILGGSQGSLLLNQVVSEALLEESWHQDTFIFHQTGKKDFLSLREKYKNIKGVEVFDFSSHIQDYYEKCDVVFSRAGSGAVAEISAMGKPLVLVPLSGTAGDHQVKNAVSLSKQEMTEWISEKEFTAEAFKQRVLQLKNNRERRELLAQNIRKRHRDGGAAVIAHWLLQKQG